ncbi:hypothetical protein VE04_09817 [Pseudogymnoascus sp. 24MN13]|nr:hypothetical protein VE04_09817 [Pseudogymnoascus sp. 24MN13]
MFAGNRGPVSPRPDNDDDDDDDEEEDIFRPGVRNARATPALSWSKVAAGLPTPCIVKDEDKEDDDATPRGGPRTPFMEFYPGEPVEECSGSEHSDTASHSRGHTRTQSAPANLYHFEKESAALETKSDTSMTDPAKDSWTSGYSLPLTPQPYDPERQPGEKPTSPRREPPRLQSTTHPDFPQYGTSRHLREPEQDPAATTAAVTATGREPAAEEVFPNPGQEGYEEFMLKTYLAMEALCASASQYGDPNESSDRVNYISDSFGALIRQAENDARARHG